MLVILLLVFFVGIVTSYSTANGGSSHSMPYSMTCQAAHGRTLYTPLG
jgi:hypothetical protein